MGVFEHVAAELAQMPAEHGESGLASVALAMAERIDDPGTRPTAAAVCARELREALVMLRRLAPTKQTNDGIDDLQRQRDRRLAASKASVGS